MYWYHPDHLGSSSFITGLDGEVTQSIDYFPSGEVFVENHKNSYNTPYKFNGKEQDSETGYYYYGARYYNPRVSLWLNVDPLAEKHPNLSPYNYCNSNPVKYIDPDGRDWYQNLATGNYVWFDGNRMYDGYSYMVGSGENSIPIIQNTPDGNPTWGVILNPDGTVTDWINREHIAKDFTIMVTPDGVKYFSGSETTRLEYRHKVYRTIAEWLGYTSTSIEIAGAAGAIPTEGTSLVLIPIGEGMGAVSLSTDIVLDVIEEKYESAITRLVIFGITAGLGKGMKNLTETKTEKAQVALLIQ